MNTDVKPCEAPCPKCGHSDVSRKFYMEGARINSISDGAMSVDPFPTHSYGEVYMLRAVRDFIGHTCRCCGYRWGTKPMRKQKKKAV